MFVFVVSLLLCFLSFPCCCVCRFLAVVFVIFLLFCLSFIAVVFVFHRCCVCCFLAVVFAFPSCCVCRFLAVVFVSLLLGLFPLPVSAFGV